MRTEGRADGLTYRQKDRHEEANSLFSHFCERAKDSGSPGTRLPRLLVRLNAPYRPRIQRSDSLPKVMNTGKGDGGLDKMYRLIS
jgi:hypothetical protein